MGMCIGCDYRILLNFVPSHNNIELTPRITSDAFYNGELESEVRTLLEESKLTFDDCIFRKDSDRERIMQLVESIRSHSIYPHLNCTTECKDRGTAIN